ncbi:MAG: TIGR03067 domain-containing protein [Verrucomicrobiota bacterium]
MNVSLLRALVLCASLSALASTSTAQTSDAAERKRLAGTWEGWVVDSDGSSQTHRRQRISELVIAADKITAKDGGGVSMGQGTYRLDPARRMIDATGTMGRVQGKTYKGIYVLQGDTLKWCSANDNPRSQRPTEFRTRPSDGQFLMILTRKK